MKRLLTTLVILTGLFAPSLAVGGEEVKIDDLVERGGRYYKPFTEEPFTGKTTGEWQYTFRRGKFHGPSVSYHENGQVRMKGAYEDGKKEGPWVTYSDNGQLLWKGTYKDGKKEGPVVFYHVNEQLMGKGTYKGGKKEGPWVWYWWNGQLRNKGTYKDGKEEGPWVFYNEDSTKDTDGNAYHEGTGTYRNGKKVSD
jgi:antitoxin component YwqK of YwqJK toxin-antitoxin module